MSVNINDLAVRRNELSNGTFYNVQTITLFKSTATNYPSWIRPPVTSYRQSTAFVESSRTAPAGFCRRRTSCAKVPWSRRRWSSSSRLGSGRKGTRDEGYCREMFCWWTGWSSRRSPRTGGDEGGGGGGGVWLNCANPKCSPDRSFMKATFLLIIMRTCNSTHFSFFP